MGDDASLKSGARKIGDFLAFFKSPKATTPRMSFR